ncbi:transposase, partial [Klebsiella pneumoniae]
RDHGVGAGHRLPRHCHAPGQESGPYPSLKDNSHMDWHIYKARHVVENMFATLKHFRGLATRYDKLKSSYSSNVALACAYVWLKL